MLMDASWPRLLTTRPSANWSPISSRKARTQRSSPRFGRLWGRLRGNAFTTAELHPRVLAVLGCPAERYALGSLRYDLAKLRAKGLVAKLPNSRRYRLLPQGYSICLIFLKLFERVYAPLTAGVLSPFTADARIDQQKWSQLDRLYQRLVDDLDALVGAPALKLRDNRVKREQNPCHGHYNGLTNREGLPGGQI